MKSLPAGALLFGLVFVGTVSCFQTGPSSNGHLKGASLNWNGHSLKDFGCSFQSNLAMVTTESTSVAAEGVLGGEELEWRPGGYQFWEHNGQQVHYVTRGDSSKPPVLLIHGFGASHFHWRYNIPELSKDYRVFAIDLIGFGLSDKPVIDYSAEVWVNQAASFIEEIIQPEYEGGAKVSVAGNSLGGYTALALSAARPGLVASCALLNGAGRFEGAAEKEARLAEEAREKSLWEKAQQAFGQAVGRAVIAASFIVTKQPQRIKQILTQVYPVDARNVDDALVESIRLPAQHPDAAEDPWIRPAAADKVQALYPGAERISVDAGHCPHDEAPSAVNTALLNWIGRHLQSTSSTATSSNAAALPRE
ncbi:unnamed protein product [Heterosigma akashiwo]